jgi:agmatinase
MADDRFTPHRNFAWLEDEYSSYERARVVVLPVPYDSTASGWVGSREGPWAIIEASGNMELYDIGIRLEPYRFGIHTLPELAVHTGGPQAMAERIEEVAGEQIDAGKFVVTGRRAHRRCRLGEGAREAHLRPLSTGLRR